MICQVILVGNLGSNPVSSSYTSSRGEPVPVCSFSVAAKNRKDDPPIWFSVRVSGKQSKAVGDYLRKGSKVYVSGNLRGYKREDGQQGQIVEADRVVFLDSKPRATGDDESRPEPEQKNSASSGEISFDDDDIPF